LWTVIANIGFAFFYFLLCVLIDSKKMTAYKTPDNRQPRFHPRYLDADVDVIREAQRVENDHSEMPIKVRNLNKVYPNGYPAVGGTSFGIGKNEVVGLLGPNGAGKTTTFSVLTMDIPKSSGEVTVMDTNVEYFDTIVRGKQIGLAA